VGGRIAEGQRCQKRAMPISALAIIALPCPTLAKLAPEFAEVAFNATGAADQDVIGASHPGIGQKFARERAEAALHAIANHGVTDFLRDGDAEAHGGIAVLALAYEQHEAGHRHAPCAVRREKIRAAADRLNRGFAQAESVLRPRARRAARTLRPPGVAERLRKP